LAYIPKKIVLEWQQMHSGNMDSKTIHSTIDAPPGVPGVSKDAPGSPEHGI